MPGPLGNQHAKGCTTSGRPSQYDLVAIAKEMLEWSFQDDALKLTMFTRQYYLKHKIILNLSRFSEWEQRSDEFAESFRFVKQNMDTNRFRAANEDRMPADWYKIRESVYCQTTKLHDRDEKLFDSSIKKEEEGRSKQNITVNVNGKGIGSGIEVSSEAVST